MLIRPNLDSKESKEKIAVAALLFGIFFVILTLRLIQLQLVHGKEYKQFSEENRITIKKIYALRGKLLDRHGRILVDNRPSFDITITRGHLGDRKAAVFAFLRNDLQLPVEQMANIEAKVSSAPRFEATTILEDVSHEIIANTKAKKYQLPGVDIVYRPMRRYPHGSLACHLFGYLREVSKNRLAQLRTANADSDISRGDYIGVWGVEALMDAQLRGSNGARPVIEDAYGRELGEEDADFLLPTLRKREAKPGMDLFLSIDLELQKRAEEVFIHKSGAVVALEPESGEILAMVSKPCFDLTKFSRTIPADYWKQLRQDPEKPLYDRATMGIYPPGSTFKVITAAAGLRERLPLDGQDFQACRGSYRIGREVKRCWRPYPGHEAVDLIAALERSCDVFFYQLGLELGIDRIAEEAKIFGLGRRSGLGLNHEQSGIVPTTAWKRKTLQQPWVDGETASVAIGQGYLAVTPLQMARVTAAVANGGKLVQPRVVQKAVNPVTGATQEFTTTVESTLPLQRQQLEQIITGLDQAVNERKGTAYWRARSNKIRIAGKTGTAQVVKQQRGEKLAAEFEDHAWFIAFAPVTQPKIAVAVLAEHSGNGAKAAAPIAKQIIEAYLVDEEEKQLSHGT